MYIIADHLIHYNFALDEYCIIISITLVSPVFQCLSHQCYIDTPHLVKYCMHVIMLQSLLLIKPHVDPLLKLYT